MRPRRWSFAARLEAMAQGARRIAGSQWRPLWTARAGRWLLVAAAVLLAGTLAGLIALWPRGSEGTVATGGGQGTEAGQVASSTTGPCEEGTCRFLEVEILGGDDRGRAAIVTLGPRDRSPDYSAGQRVRILAGERQAGVEEAGPSTSRLPGAEGSGRPLAQYTYSVVDYDRRAPMLWLALGFAAFVVVAARFRGALALVGLGTSILVVTQFVVPAMLAGRPAFLVALVGALAAMFVTIVLTSGVGAQSLAASLGIAMSLVLCAGLGLAYVHVAHLTGSGSEAAFTLRQQTPDLSLQGLVLAGFVIGAVGVLADTAVTQSSAVMALRRANPQLGLRAIYREAFTIGRDHLSATVHTLVFAYVGASLPLLLVFKTAGVSFTDAINGQDVAEPVVATLIGAIGIVAAVPFSTGLAALLATSLPPDAVPVDEHGHHH